MKYGKKDSGCSPPSFIRTGNADGKQPEAEPACLGPHGAGPSASECYDGRAGGNKGTGEGRDDRAAQYSRMAVRRGRECKRAAVRQKSGGRERFMSMALFPWHFRQSVKRFLRIGHGKKGVVSLQESFHGPCSVRKWIRRAVRLILEERRTPLQP